MFPWGCVVPLRKALYSPATSPSLTSQSPRSPGDGTIASPATPAPPLVPSSSHPLAHRPHAKTDKEDVDSPPLRTASLPALGSDSCDANDDFVLVTLCDESAQGKERKEKGNGNKQQQDLKEDKSDPGPHQRDKIDELYRFFGYFHTNRHDEKRIFEVLKQMDATTLTFFLEDQAAVRKLLKSVDDRLFGPDWRSAGKEHTHHTFSYLSVFCFFLCVCVCVAFCFVLWLSSFFSSPVVCPIYALAVPLQLCVRDDSLCAG